MEYLLQFTAYLRGRVRFREKRADAKLGDTVGSFGVGVGADHDYRGCGEPLVLPDATDQLEAVHARHIEVGDDCADTLAAAVQNFESVYSRRGGEYRDARDREESDFESRRAVFRILDDENPVALRCH